MPENAPEQQAGKLVQKLNQKQENAIKKNDNKIKNALKNHDIIGTLKDMFDYLCTWRNRRFIGSIC